tara:strand:+ start:763 stop:987 length:225 start_codon:yes stop_codon:yes gene_type:complete
MSEFNDWVVVYTSTDKFDVELIQGHLKEAGIESVVYDHQDSMMKMLNNSNYSVGLFVHPENETVAKEYIQKHNK